jgi:alpha-tubulin suppressor-like RCC1 family protein
VTFPVRRVRSLALLLTGLSLGGCGLDLTGPGDVNNGLVAAGDFLSCYLTAEGTAYCWGLNASGEVGTGSLNGQRSPARVATTVPLISLQAGRAHSCALDQDGQAYCWGDNTLGALASEVETQRAFPSPSATGFTFRSIGVGAAHSCGLTRRGAVFCWGANDRGQLGTLEVTMTCGNIPCRRDPNPVEGGLTFIDLAVGTAHGCGLTPDRAAYCWGRNTFGGLGNGFLADAGNPVVVRGEHAFQSLSAGEGHTCGLTTDGTAYCWGDNIFGQLGVGGVDSVCSEAGRTCSSVPVRADTDERFTAIAAGGLHTCALTSDGAAYCWGDNAFGQLGNRGLHGRVPGPVSGGLTFTSIATGSAHTCAVTPDGAVYCWGDNLLLQIGTGGVGIRFPEPFLVEMPAQ